MQKKFLLNLILLLGLNLLIKPFWIFGIDRTVQNVVGSENYGFYFAILNFSFLFNVILDLGISNFNGRNIARHSQLLRKYFSGILVMKMILALAYGLFILLLGYIIGYDESQLYLLKWVAFNQVLLSFIIYLRSNISGLLMLKTDSFISVLDRFFMIAICSYLLWGRVSGDPFQIEWFVYAQTTAYMATAIIAFLVVIKKSGFIKLRWDRVFLSLLIKQSYPFALLVLLMSIYGRVDAVFIERLLGGDLGELQSGIFAKAFRICDAGNNFALLFGVLLLPIFSRMIKQKESVASLVKLSFSIIFVGSVTVAICSYFFNLEIMELLYTKHESETELLFQQRLMQAANVYRILIFSFVAVSANYIFSTLLTANGNLKQLNIIASLAVVLSVVLNLILVPDYFAVGSAIASLVAQAFTAILLIFYASKFFKFRFNHKFLLSLLGFVLGLILFNILIKEIQINWLYQFSIMLICALILAFILRLFSLRSLISFIRNA